MTYFRTILAMSMHVAYDDDDNLRQHMPTSAATYKIPDRDFYRKNFNTFASIYNHLQSRVYERRFEDRRVLQSHYCELARVRTPYSTIKSNPSDGVCSRFLRRGFTKPNKIQFNAAVWSADARWLVLGTQVRRLVAFSSMIRH